jgi:DUF1009 family protein
MSIGFGKIAIIAGGGQLPLELAETLQNQNSDFIISRIRGISDSNLDKFQGHDAGLGEFGKRFALLKQAGVNSVVLAGYIKRPEFSKIGLDAYGLKMLPKMISEGRKGDDALLRLMIAEFENNGYKVLGVEEIRSDFIATEGSIGTIIPNPENHSDIRTAIPIARQIGVLDIGQGVVICDGVTLAVEAQEGTDEMLRRIISLPEHIRGTKNVPKGILLKCPKPIQEMRIDLPTIGINTVENAYNAGLSGIALEAGKAIILEREKVIKLANNLGLFIYGFTDKDLHGG